MGELGDVLELLAAPTPRWHTLQGSVEDWTDPSAWQRATDRAQARFGMPRRDSPPGDPSARTTDRPPCTTTARVWARGRDLRIERTVTDALEQARVLTVVRDGQAWWRLGDGRVQVAVPPARGVQF